MFLFNHYYCTTHISHKPHCDLYLAYPEDDPEQRVVLKVFDAQCILPTTTHEDFQRMERRLQSLKYSHIVAMLELGKAQGKPYLVSAYQSGNTLRQYLDHLSSGYLSLDDAMALVMQVGQAAAFAHTQGMVHQDIRPENILLNDQGQAFLTNFYLGDIIREPGLKNRPDRRAASYLSPEQTIGIASPASDQYALGCLLYELVTGKFPDLVSRRQPSPLLPLFPHQLETVILRTLALKPEERYPSVTTFLAELKLAVQPEPAIFSHMMENENVSAVHPALAFHAHITSLDAFSLYEPTADMAEVIPPENVAVEPESHAVSSKEDQLVTYSPHDTPKGAQTDEQSTVIVRTIPIWKRPAIASGVALTILVIALLLAYAFNSRVGPEVKHAPALAVSTTIISKTTMPSTAVPPTAKVVAPQPATQASHQNPVSGPSSQPVLIPTPKPPGVGSIQIDSGGSGAGSFIGDEDYSNITPGRPSSASNDSSSTIDTSGVSNPAPENVYQSARIGDCFYTISHLTPHASYMVRLHFAETYWTRPGKRTFNVILNARMVLHNFDIFATAGAENKAVVEQLVVLADSTGTITLQFLTVKNNAQINAIEVLAV